MNQSYDIVVIGGGHAGTEAAWAAARMGCSVALITMRADAIGRMSCNPAIGGLGKGQMVREIDALGGLMGLAIDAAGIQFRMLNRSKGPAVWAPRAQADRALYAEAVQGLLASVDGLEIVEGLVESLVVEEPAGGGDRGSPTAPECQGKIGVRSSEIGNAHIAGIRLQDGRELHCRAVVVTTGTFLRGLMHCGEQQAGGGRVGEGSAISLSDDLARLGFTLGRLKTGTPPRVHRDSIDFSRLTPQPGDDPAAPFSFLTRGITQRQVDCWITHTNPRCHEAIRANIHRAPMYSGQIQSRGPRYCPSIEDKIMRFADKASHQVFLEPEGYDNPWIYCNGISTSLPRDVQDEMVHAIPGLERARIVQYGYAVEYDWVPTDQILSTLETKRIAGLYLAGQINGTSGYEEAAGQGLLAGVNAAARILERVPLVLRRDQAYLGVMIDDLVTRPPDEPYRMFTSRAEYRLHLRSDNADRRLTPLGWQIGLVGEERWKVYGQKGAAIDALTQLVDAVRVDGQPLKVLLRRPDVRLNDLHTQIPQLLQFSPEVQEAVQIEARYAGYLEREARQIARHRQMEDKTIPSSFNYRSIPELRIEARERLTRFRPHNLGQAARLSGISPSDIATLSLYLFRRRPPA